MKTYSFITFRKVGHKCNNEEMSFASASSLINRGFLCLLLQRESYVEGHQLYYTDDWAGMVRTLEQSLLEFYKALEECRILCDGPLKYQDNLEFPRVRETYVMSYNNILPAYTTEQGCVIGLGVMCVCVC